MRSRRTQGRYRGVMLLASLLMMILLAGCQAAPTSSIYENQEAHVRLVKPKHWKVAYYERSGQIILEAKYGGKENSSARVEILGDFGPSPTMLTDPVGQLQADIQRIQMLYELDSLAIIQPPTISQIKEHETTRAIIGLPLSELPDDAVINQVSGGEPGIMQTVDIRILTNRRSECSLLVYFYKGKSEVLNAEAEGIVESIQCTYPEK